MGVEVFEAADGGEVDYGGDTGYFVLKGFECIGGELLLLLAEMGGKPGDEGRFVVGFGFFAEGDELLSDIAAFDSAGCAVAE